MAFIFALSSIAHPPTPPSIISDKEIHAALYAVLSFLVLRAMTSGWAEGVTLRSVLLAVVICTLYGASDELHQHFVPPRQMDAFDLLADAVGSTIAAAALYAWAIIRGRHAL